MRLLPLLLLLRLLPLLLDLLEQEPREVVKRSAGDLDNQLLDSIVELVVYSEWHYENGASYKNGAR